MSWLSCSFQRCTCKKNKTVDPSYNFEHSVSNGKSLYQSIAIFYTLFRKMGFNLIVFFFHSQWSFMLLSSAVTMVTLSARYSDMPSFFPQHISSSLFSHSHSLIMSSPHVWRSNFWWNYHSVTSNPLFRWWWDITVVLVYK